LHVVNGVNFRVVDLYLAKVDVKSTSTTAIISEFKDCPFFINALVMSGSYNLCLFFMATDLKRLEGIVDHHLRCNPKVKDVTMNVVISTAKDFVLPLSIDYDNEKQLSCKQHCGDVAEKLNDQNTLQ
ncbi:MAG: Lrp/AsnC ligand binding domain-containing protein, partial [Candidatus Woesearchaeota archaeon]